MYCLFWVWVFCSVDFGLGFCLLGLVRGPLRGGFGSARGRGAQFGQADQVQSGDGEGEDGGDACAASELDTLVSGLGLDPAEHLLDALAAPQADGIAT